MKQNYKIKQCCICNQDYKQYKSTVKVCSTRCAVTHGRQKEEEKRAKEWRKEKRERKEKLKTKADYQRELQVVFNRYIRLRDKNEPCISCGNKLGSKFDAGHYRSVGSCPELRFEENNVHAQCVHCNQHLHGNLIEYRKGLINRYGLAVVDWLELNHEPKHYTIEELKEMKKHYLNEIKSIK